MIWFPMRQLICAGIGEILVVTFIHHTGSIVQSFGSGKRFGCEFTYRVQEKPAAPRKRWRKHFRGRVN
jgi:glucose-1-phosphate thymidylyltransferase